MQMPHFYWSAATNTRLCSVPAASNYTNRKHCHFEYQYKNMKKHKGVILTGLNIRNYRKRWAFICRSEMGELSKAVHIVKQILVFSVLPIVVLTSSMTRYYVNTFELLIMMFEVIRKIDTVYSSQKKQNKHYWTSVQNDLKKNKRCTKITVRLLKPWMFM